MKKVKNNKLLMVIVVGIALGVLIDWVRFDVKINKKIVEERKIINEVKPTVVATATPTKAPIKQMSFSEMNKIYGPCAKVPVLMYHHIQTAKEASVKRQTGLTVTPEDFRKNLEYLKSNNYTVVSLSDLVAFFDSGKDLPVKAVVITLDDAYEDNYSQMWPILKEFGFKATIFIPTGLIQNPDYLSWNQMKEMSSAGLIYFGNHTWSHHSSSGTSEVLEKEISLADTQLAEHGENQSKIFAYPYGNPSSGAKVVLQKLDYKIAFTTVHGSIQCKGKRYELPRIRVGGSNLKTYGL